MKTQTNQNSPLYLFATLNGEVMLTKEWLSDKDIGYKISPYGEITVGGYLNLRGTKITKLPDNLTVGGFLDLRGTKITQLPDNLTVGGYLDLQDTEITQLPDNLTVGGYLDLRGTKITQLPDNLIVGGSLYLRGTKMLTQKESKRPSRDFSTKLKSSIEVKLNLRGWSIADGVLSKVLSTKGSVSRVLIAGQKKQTYLIRDKEGNYAHGKTIAKAREDLIYKVVASFDGDLPEKATGKEWVGIYRAVTGACATGCKRFVNQVGKSLDDTYTVEEIARLVQGQYGAESFAEKLK